MEPLERAEKQRQFLAAWEKHKSITHALLECGLLWQHTQSWRRWDRSFREAYDALRQRLYARPVVLIKIVADNTAG